RRRIACCARVASGHAAAPLMSVMNSRRFMAARSFDHLVGDREHAPRQGEVECFGGLQIDDEFKPCGKLYGHVGWLFALENAADVIPGAALGICLTRAVAHQSAPNGKFALRVNGRNRKPGSEFDEALAVSHEKRSTPHKESARG